MLSGQGAIVDRKRVFPDIQSTPPHCFGFIILPLREKHCAKHVEAPPHIGMVRAKRRLTNGESLAEKRCSLIELPGAVEYAGLAIEAFHDFGMGSSQLSLNRCVRGLECFPRFLVFAFAEQEAADLLLNASSFGSPFITGVTQYLIRPAIERPGFPLALLEFVEFGETEQSVGDARVTSPESHFELFQSVSVVALRRRIVGKLQLDPSKRQYGGCRLWMVVAPPLIGKQHHLFGCFQSSWEIADAHQRRGLLLHLVVGQRPGRRGKHD